MRKTAQSILLVMALSCLTILTTGIASAQEVTGNIVGTVKDSTGALVPGATVNVRNTDKNIIVRTITTDGAGEYSAPLLPIGVYSVSAEAAGFQKSTRSAIELSVSDHLTIDLALQVGTVQQEVTVQAAPLQVNLQTAAVEGLITGTQIRELSLNNRNYEQLVALMPGVSVGTATDQLYVGVTSPSGFSNQINFSINGGRPTQNNWTIDGADNVDRGANLTLLNYPSVDAIAEFKVERGLFNPEFGRSSSGEINVVTRSGGSDFHGSAYEFFRNNVLSANSFFNNRNGIPNPALRYNDFGWTFGGPVYIPHHYNADKTKTFFFYSEEIRRILTYTTFSSGETPTAQELQGNFAATGPVCLNVACTLTGTQVPAIDPVAAAYIKDIFSKLPAPDPSNGNTLTFVGRNTFNYREENIRVDHVFGPRLAVFGRWLNDSIPTIEPGGIFTGSSLPGVGTTHTNSPGHNLAVRVTMSLSPTSLNELGYAYSYGAVLSNPTGLDGTKQSPNVAAALKLVFPSTVPRVADISFLDSGEGVTGFGAYLDYNRNHNLFDTLTLVRGRHSLKFGGTYNHYNKSENAGGGNNGAFNFGDFTGNFGTFQQDWANFLLGEVASYSQTSADFRPNVIAHQIEWYAQDQFRLRPNLTLTYGVRHSLYRQPYDAGGNLSNFDPQRFNRSTVPALDPTSGGFASGQALTPANYLNGVIIGVNGCKHFNPQEFPVTAAAPTCSPFGNAVAAQQNSSIAPRLGVAWDPFGHGTTSIRAGYGIFYDSPSVNSIETNIFNDPPFVNSVNINNTTFANPSGGAVSVNTFPIALNAFAPDWKTPYTQEWSLDMQHQVTPTLLVEAGYHGNKGTHLIGQIDINEPVPGAYQTAGLTPPGVPIKFATTALLNLIRPYPGYDAINMFKTIFDSNYHSLQVQVQKRFSASSQLNFNYTWSHALTTSQSDFRVPQNSYNIGDEYGPAQFDRRHIFNANFIYDLPWLKNQEGLTGHLLGGWEVSGIVNFYSGLPLTVTGGRSVDPAGLGLLDNASNSSRRPDQVGNPNANAPHTLQKWFNTAAFANIPLPTTRPGDSSRGSVTGPGAERFDLSLFKNIKLSERFNAQFRAESFNTLNHTNFNTIRTSLSSGTFGRVLSARDPRIIQLALKLNF